MAVVKIYRRILKYYEYTTRIIRGKYLMVIRFERHLILISEKNKYSNQFSRIIFNILYF